MMGMTPDPSAASPAVVLKSLRDKSVRQHHPRLFAGAIKDVIGRPKDGSVVDVFDNKGEWLARGAINQQSPTAVRVLTWDPSEVIDDAFWARRVRAAVERRDRDPNLADTDARRLIFSESDGLPGVVADDYAGYVVVQFATLLALRAKDVVLDALEQALRPRAIIPVADDERLKHERVQFDVRRLLEPRGAPPDGPVLIHERGLRYWVDVVGGQKTGFYLDQRESRARLARYAAGAAVLNAFSYTGAFGVVALAHGAASVVNVDSSGDALTLADRNAAANALPRPDGQAWANAIGDAFEDVRARRKNGERFDIVILDPPKFAHNVDQIERASRAYKDLNRVGLSLVRPGGLLATFSCSGVIDAKLFQQIIFSAAIEANRDAMIVEQFFQASDHPVALNYPESAYLKGLLLRVA